MKTDWGRNPEGWDRMALWVSGESQGAVRISSEMIAGDQDEQTSRIVRKTEALTEDQKLPRKFA